MLPAAVFCSGAGFKAELFISLESAAAAVKGLLQVTVLIDLVLTDYWFECGILLCLRFNSVKTFIATKNMSFELKFLTLPPLILIFVYISHGGLILLSQGG